MFVTGFDAKHHGFVPAARVVVAFVAPSITVTLALVLFALGFGLIILGHTITNEWMEAPLAVAGGLGVAIAHWVNHRECKKCPRCQHEQCGHAH